MSRRCVIVFPSFIISRLSRVHILARLIEAKGNRRQSRVRHHKIRKCGSSLQNFCPSCARIGSRSILHEKTLIAAVSCSKTLM
mmetsp:Transcript_7107/g.14830  ORF Transcript_7107/g.14830 Transcript_7107/m.14830 type:complete len:83 (-) Transcript_7107:1050-1298(-)